jgi:hypothetical protein
MRFMVGYSVWEKQDMIGWLLEGIVKSFDPAKTDIVFHFDACADASEANYDAMAGHYLWRYGKWLPQQTQKISSSVEVREVGGHNRLIQHFMNSNCDMLIVAQDDQRFLKDVCPHLEALHARYGDRLGIVGGRDAYYANYGGFVGSRWSESLVNERVDHGQFVERPYMNSGPVAYTRKVVESVGLLDEEFRAYYVWDDYGARAKANGFVNGVMGMDVIHAKFGRTKATEWCDWSAQDLARLHAKHPSL